ncbi:LolA family protein [Alkaliphilus crotonatoxidans]
MKWGRLVLMLIPCLLLTACGQPTKEEVYYDAQKRLSEIKAYQCTALIKVQRENEEREYVFRQTFQYPDRYHLEVLAPEELKGNVTVSNGKTTWLHNPSINQYWRLEPFEKSQEQLMFIGYFMRNLFASEESTLEQRKVETGEQVGITTPLPGGGYYFQQQRLWIDVDSLMPQSLEIVDESGMIRFKVEYENFELNPELDDEIFQPKWEE